MSNLMCPYCDACLEDPDDCYDTNHTYTYTCDECEKSFVYTVEYSRDYYANQADCLNGAEHNYKEKTCYPEYMGVGVYICRDCEHREVKWAERLEKLKALLETAPLPEHQYIRHQMDEAIIKAGQEAKK